MEIEKLLQELDWALLSYQGMSGYNPMVCETVRICRKDTPAYDRAREVLRQCRVAVMFANASIYLLFEKIQNCLEAQDGSNG